LGYNQRLRAFKGMLVHSLFNLKLALRFLRLS